MNSENSNFKALGNNFVIVWVVKTVFAFMIGAAVGFAIAQLLFCARTVVKELSGALLLGSIVGACVGIAQTGQIKNIVRDPKWWAIASIVGWAIALFLVEVNWPLSLCLKSSNSASLTQNNLIRAIASLISVFAEQMERLIVGEVIYGGIYFTVSVLLMGSLMGVMLGIPQGLGQWFVLRKDLPRSSMMIVVNVLIWAATYVLIIFLIDLVNFNQILTLLLIPVVLIEPAAVTALVLAWLQAKKTGTRH